MSEFRNTLIESCEAGRLSAMSVVSDPRQKNCGTTAVDRFSEGEVDDVLTGGVAGL